MSKAAHAHLFFPVCFSRRMDRMCGLSRSSSKTQGEEAGEARVETSWPPLPSVGALSDASSLFIFLVSPLTCLPFPRLHLGYSSSGSHRLKIPLNSNPKPAQLLVLIMRKPIMIPDGYLLNPCSVSSSTPKDLQSLPISVPKAACCRTMNSFIKSCLLDIHLK